MKISIGAEMSPNIEFSIGEAINVYILLEIADLKKRIEALEKSCGDLQTQDKHQQKVGIKSPFPAQKHTKTDRGINLKRLKKQYWTAEREDLLRDNFYKKSMAELVQILPGFSEVEILAKASFMGMKKKKDENPGSTANKESSKQL